MAGMQPRVQAPGTVAKGEVFVVKTLVAHPMETGLRRDGAGQVIPRDIVNQVTCQYNDVIVFSADLREAVAANPYISFYVRAAESGLLRFTWRADDGETVTIETPLTVTG